MRSLSFIASMLVSVFLLVQPGEVQAQSWKRLCVSGGATGGANNHTWQKINTQATGGGTWKKAGNCVAAPPPPTPTPPPPEPTGPPRNVFDGHSIANDLWGFTKDYEKGEGWSQLTLAADGSGTATGGPNFQTERAYGAVSGSWRAPGYSGGQFEIMWTITKASALAGDFYSNDGVTHALTSSSPQGVWATLEAGWYLRLGAWTGPCDARLADASVFFEYTVRVKQDPSISRTQAATIAAHGWEGNFSECV